MDDVENKIALEALGYLYSLADRDCDCMYRDEKCDVENANCETCAARAACDRLERLITPSPKPLQEKRLTNPAERIFWEQWQRLNKRQRGINGGFTALEHILDPNLDDERQGAVPLLLRKPPPPVSTRDAQVAAAVIQWLGTNGGKCFIDECERRIERERVIRDKNLGGWTPFIDPHPAAEKDPIAEQVAEQLAGELVPASKPRLQQHFKARFFHALRFLVNRVEVGQGDAV